MWFSSYYKNIDDSQISFKISFCKQDANNQRIWFLCFFFFKASFMMAESAVWRFPRDLLIYGHLAEPSPTLPYLKPIKIYKLKASGKEHNLGNCLLGNLTTARVPWKSALNTIVVHPISSQLYRRACGQGLAGKRPGCPSSWLAGGEWC